MFGIIFNPSSELTDVVSAVKRLDAAEKAFTNRVRAIPTIDSTRPAMASMLTAHDKLIAALDVATAAKTVTSLNTAMSKVYPTGQAADAAELKLGDTLGVFTDKPTGHLAPASLPVVVPNLSAHPLSVEGSPTYGASYIPSGYQQVSGPGQQVSERYTTPSKWTNTSVSTTVVVAGKTDGSGNAASALVTCRSSGTGTTAGDEYVLGYNVIGGLFIDRVGPGGVQYLITSSSPAAKSGASVDLRADCVGSYLTLYINGKPRLQVYDNQLPNGNVGLSSGGPGAAVFSSFTVSGDTK